MLDLINFLLAFTSIIILVIKDIISSKKKNEELKKHDKKFFSSITSKEIKLLKKLLILYISVGTVSNIFELFTSDFSRHLLQNGLNSLLYLPINIYYSYLICKWIPDNLYGDRRIVYIIATLVVALTKLSIIDYGSNVESGVDCFFCFRFLLLQEFL